MNNGHRGIWLKFAAHALSGWRASENDIADERYTAQQLTSLAAHDADSMLEKYISRFGKLDIKNPEEVLPEKDEG